MVYAAPSFPAPCAPTASSSETAPKGPRRPYAAPRLTTDAGLPHRTQKSAYTYDIPLSPNSITGGPLSAGPS